MHIAYWCTDQLLCTYTSIINLRDSCMQEKRENGKYTEIFRVPAVRVSAKLGNKYMFQLTFFDQDLVRKQITFKGKSQAHSAYPSSGL